MKFCGKQCGFARCLPQNLMYVPAILSDLELGIPHTYLGFPDYEKDIIMLQIQFWFHHTLSSKLLVKIQQKISCPLLFKVAHAFRITNTDLNQTLHIYSQKRRLHARTYHIRKLHLITNDVFIDVMIVVIHSIAKKRIREGICICNTGIITHSLLAEGIKGLILVRIISLIEEVVEQIYIRRQNMSMILRQQ